MLKLRWVCMNRSVMDDGSCTCETWIDQWTRQPYAVAGFPNEKRYIPVRYDGNTLHPLGIGGGNVACFDTPEAARAFLFAHVNHGEAKGGGDA